nr:unnamed protein product [Digitaria exilis]
MQPQRQRARACAMRCRLLEIKAKTKGASLGKGKNNHRAGRVVFMDHMDLPRGPWDRARRARAHHHARLNLAGGIV